MTATASQRVIKAQNKLLEAGGERLTGYLHPEAAEALRELRAAGYAKSKIGVISAALLDAARKIARRKA